MSALPSTDQDILLPKIPKPDRVLKTLEDNLYRTEPTVYGLMHASWTSRLALRAGFDTLLASGKYSDLQFRCQGRIFNVHKAIVCPQSTVIAAMCDSGLSEAKTGEIEITIADIPSVERFLSYLYEGWYDDREEYSKRESELAQSASYIEHLPARDQCMVNNLRMFVLADYYQVEEMANLAKHMWHQRTASVLEDPKFTVKALLELVREVYETVPESEAAESFRQIVMRKALAEFCDSEDEPHPDFLDYLEENPVFMKEWTRALVCKNKSSKHDLAVSKAEKSRAEKMLWYEQQLLSIAEKEKKIVELEKSELELALAKLQVDDDYSEQPIKRRRLTHA